MGFRTPNPCEIPRRYIIAHALQLSKWSSYLVRGKQASPSRKSSSSQPVTGDRNHDLRGCSTNYLWHVAKHPTAQPCNRRTLAPAVQEADLPLLLLPLHDELAERREPELWLVGLGTAPLLRSTSAGMTYKPPAHRQMPKRMLQDSPHKRTRPQTGSSLYRKLSVRRRHMVCRILHRPRNARLQHFHEGSLALVLQVLLPLPRATLVASSLRQSARRVPSVRQALWSMLKLSLAKPSL